MGDEDYDDSFTGGGVASSGPKRQPMPVVKVWNVNPQNPTLPQTPGMVIRKTSKVGDKFVNDDLIVEKIRCVILFHSRARALKAFKGRLVCGSHDGRTPSIQIKDPLCRKATVADVTKIISQWKNSDQAKVDAILAEVTDGAVLTSCGLKTASGATIPLCPRALKDPDTGQFGGCKPHIFVRCYDIDRDVEFRMELRSDSISEGGKYSSPFFKFFEHLRDKGPIINGKQRGAPCFKYAVDLTPIKKGELYILNVTNIEALPDDQVPALKERALNAKAVYEKNAAYIPKAEFDKSKQREQERVSSPSSLNVISDTLSPIDNSVDSVDWDVDDIPF